MNLSNFLHHFSHGKSNTYTYTPIHGIFEWFLAQGKEDQYYFYSFLFSLFGFFSFSIHGQITTIWMESVRYSIHGRIYC